MERTGRPSLQQTRATAVEETVQHYHGRISSVAISRLSNIPQASVHRILRHQLKLYPYRIHVVHSLTDGDKQTRLHFANEMLQRNSEDPNLVNTILWTDEAHFSLNGEVNTWNCRIWATENPNELYQPGA